MKATHAVLECRQEGEWALSGTLNFTSVAELWHTSQHTFANHLPRQIDLSGVVYSDSSGIALLVAWLRRVKQRNGHLHLIHIPAQMQAIIRVTALEPLFTIPTIDHTDSTDP